MSNIIHPSDFFFIHQDRQLSQGPCNERNHQIRLQNQLHTHLNPLMNDYFLKLQQSGYFNNVASTTPCRFDVLENQNNQIEISVNDTTRYTLLDSNTNLDLITTARRIIDIVQRIWSEDLCNQQHATFPPPHSTSSSTQLMHQQYPENHLSHSTNSSLNSTFSSPHASSIQEGTETTLPITPHAESSLSSHASFGPSPQPISQHSHEIVAESNFPHPTNSSLGLTHSATHSCNSPTHPQYPFPSRLPIGLSMMMSPTQHSPTHSGTSTPFPTSNSSMLLSPSRFQDDEEKRLEEIRKNAVEASTLLRQSLANMRVSGSSTHPLLAPTTNWPLTIDQFIYYEEKERTALWIDEFMEQPKKHDERVAFHQCSQSRENQNPPLQTTL